MTGELVRLEAMPMDQVVGHVQTIHDLMKTVLKEGTHYGIIPGCGDKPTLLQPGAQKIALTFGFGERYRVEAIDLPKGHREYRIVCELYSRGGQMLIGEGVGVCSTMEGKYRFRQQNTGREVPQEYWQNRDPELLGGQQFSAAKRGGKWVIIQRVEHDNPADYYNTAAKIAAKRAYVSAVRDNTAASDIFAVDLEDLPPRETEAEITDAEEIKPTPATPSEGEIRFRFGKHKGKAISDRSVAIDYVQWAAKTVGESVNDPEKEKYKQENAELALALKAEVKRREAEEEAPGDLFPEPDLEEPGPPPPEEPSAIPKSVTEAQVKMIRAWGKTASIGSDEYLRWAQVESIGELSAKQAHEIIRWLKAQAEEREMK
ncbi:MAG: hypothetical protein ABIH23_08380 [bacterium]